AESVEPAEAPTDTPEPTATTDPDATSEPTATPDPDATSEPTADPGTSAAPEDSAAPKAMRPFGRAALAEEDDVEAMRERLDEARKNLAKLAAAIAEQSELVDALSAALDVDRDTLEKRLAELAALGEDSEDVGSRSEEVQRVIDMLAERIVKLDAELRKIDADSVPDALRQAIAVLREQISDIEASDAYQAMALLKDPDALKAQYAQVKDGVAQLNDGIEQIDGALEKLNKGVIPGGFIEGIDEDTNLADARSALTAARAKALSGFADAAARISAGEAELNKARKEFNDKRDEALQNAGLDGVITVQMVSGLIGAQNFAMPAGYVYDADSEQVLVRVGEKFDSLDALRRMKLFHLGLDSIQDVRLLDVASVALADDRDEVFTKLNGADGILLSLEKQSTYSTADVAGAILARADALMAEDPSLHIVDLMNQGEYISIIVDSVLNNLLSGGGLAILVLLLFLMDLRPTLTVAFSIPISVVIAFVCMYFTGITLNVLSLSGLSLGIGMLVDNSIVAIENIYRLHDEEGVPLLRACVEGVRSVSGALFASTLTTICVFLPIVFVQGMARDLFSDMGLSIAFSLLASLLVALTVVPAMCSFLMRRSRPRRHPVFGVLQRFYTFLLRGALRVKPLVLLAALGLLAFAAMQVPKMGISFMPEVNSRQMSATLALDPEMPDAQQKELAVAIMDDMMQVDGVDSVGLMGGSGGLLGGLTEGGGMSYYIMIDEKAGRPNADIAREMADIGQRRGADLSVSASTMDISMLTGSGISAEITGSDIETLQRIALDVAELARQTEGVVDVSDGLEDAVPEMRIRVDKEKAIDSGLTTAQVFQFIAQKVMGRVQITKLTLDGKDLGVYMRDGANSELRPEDLENLEIEVDGETENKRVRVGDIAEVLETQSLSTIHRASQRRLVTVSFGIAEGYSANLVSDAFAAKLKDYAVPAGYSVDLAGENETVMKIMHDLVWMVVVAVLLIFLIMVAQFQSFKSPIIVMFTIPLAFTGGLLALIVTGMDLSIVSMLGFLVLSGVVVNNGIVFIDCVNQLRIGGMEKREALVETGRIRLRPILMTALTTILGVSTMALGRGMGAEMMQPMAVVSIGGLSYATLMTLFVVPVLYDLLNGRTMKAREIQMIKEAAGMNGNDILEGESHAPTPDAPAIPVPEAPAIPAPDAPAIPAPEAPEEPAPKPPEAPAPATPAVTPDSFRYTPPPKAVRVKMGRRE
ncbi:MAG: efflux RND transporter permease subunit, partial [Clostridia bacterium]|nr:efflux RND transporter permease subunit [Clostridia bacterium]